MMILIVKIGRAREACCLRQKRQKIQRQGTNMGRGVNLVKGDGCMGYEMLRFVSRVRIWLL